MSAARTGSPSPGWWALGLAVAAGCSTIPTVGAADGGDAAVAVDDGAERDAGVADAGADADVPADADRFGACGAGAYRALCACTAITDTGELQRCQQAAYARFPRCVQCLAETLGMECCRASYDALLACAGANGCGDQVCIDAHCGPAQAAYARCQMTAQGVPTCQQALRACIADFPRLMMCE